MRLPEGFKVNEMVRLAPQEAHWGVSYRRIIMRDQPRGAAVYGIDLGKTSFHVVGLDASGHTIQRLKLGRTTVFQFSGTQP